MKSWSPKRAILRPVFEANGSYTLFMAVTGHRRAQFYYTTVDVPMRGERSFTTNDAIMPLLLYAHSGCSLARQGQDAAASRHARPSRRRGREDSLPAGHPASQRPPNEWPDVDQETHEHHGPVKPTFGLIITTTTAKATRSAGTEQHKYCLPLLRSRLDKSGKRRW